MVNEFLYKKNKDMYVKLSEYLTVKGHSDLASQIAQAVDLFDAAIANKKVRGTHTIQLTSKDFALSDSLDANLKYLNMTNIFDGALNYLIFNGVISTYNKTKLVLTDSNEVGIEIELK